MHERHNPASFEVGFFCNEQTAKYDSEKLPIRNAAGTRRPAARSRDRFARTADLPDHVLCFRQRRTGRGSLRPARRGQHLHPSEQSHDLGFRRAHGCARRRHGGRGRRIGHGRPVSGVQQSGRSGRQYRQHVVSLRRHVQPVQAYVRPHRRRSALRSGRRHPKHRIAH